MSRRKEPDTGLERPRPLAVTDASGESAGYAMTAPLSGEPSAPPPSDSDPRLVEGETIAGRYRILRYLARGGMGEVYEAEDLQLGERLALKTIREETRDPISEERFKREIQLSRKVTHPNVCRIFDVGFHDYADGRRVVFLTMELLSGETLLERLRRDGPLSIEEATGVVRQIAAALTAAHGANVVHRDLKSANVMLVPREGAGLRAVVTDFGLAHVTSGEDRARTLSGSGGIVGTPGYMAPEQVEGGEISARTDVYALGVVMYEMVTAQLPFDGATPLSIAAKRLTTPAPSPRKLRPELPGRWDRTILACLAREPRDRPPTPRAVVELLDDELDRTSLRIAKLNRRAPMVRPLLAVAVLAITAVVAWKWSRREVTLADELLRRGVSLGDFSAVDPERVGGHAVAVRNAVRTDLAFDLPVADSPVQLGLPADPLRFGLVRRAPSAEPPLLLEVQLSVGEPGPEQTVEIALRLVDPRNHAVRARIVERGTVRHLEDAVERLGNRLRTTAGLASGRAAPLDAAGKEALERVRASLRRGELVDALEQAEAGLQHAPRSVELRFMISRVLAGLRMDISSAVAVRRTLALGEPEDAFWRERVHALAVRRDATLSASVLETLARAHPEDLDLQLDLVTVYTQAQRFTDARALGARLIAAASTPEEKLRIELITLIVDYRLSRYEQVLRGFAALAERAEAMHLPGLALEARIPGCQAAASQARSDFASALCTEMGRNARALRRFDGAVVEANAHTSIAILGETVDQVALSKAAIGLAQQLGGRRALSEATNNLALATADLGTAPHDKTLFETALALARDIHDHTTVSTILQNLAYYVGEEGRLNDAAAYLKEARDLARDSGGEATAAWVSCELARLQCKQGEMREAQEALAEGQQLLQQVPGDADAIESCWMAEVTIGTELDELKRAGLALGHYLDRMRATATESGIAPYAIRRCDLVFAAQDWRRLRSCVADHRSNWPAVEGSDRAIELVLFDALAALHLGGRPLGRERLATLRRDVDSMKASSHQVWVELMLFELERLSGIPAAELMPPIDHFVAKAAAGGFTLAELYGVRQRVYLLARDRSPQLGAEVAAFVARARRHGFVWLARDVGKLHAARNLDR